MDCTYINDNDTPLLCVACESRARHPQAAGKWCAMTCPIHTPAGQTDLQLCFTCFDSTEKCSSCNAEVPGGSMVRVRCAKDQCNVSASLCKGCSDISADARTFTCRTCWNRDGQLCVYCGSRPVKQDYFSERACRSCFTSHSCEKCHADQRHAMPSRSAPSPVRNESQSCAVVPAAYYRL